MNLNDDDLCPTFTLVQRSPRFRLPLPLVSAQWQAACVSVDGGAGGDGFFLQNTATPDRNLCGSMTYRAYQANCYDPTGDDSGSANLLTAYIFNEAEGEESLEKGFITQTYGGGWGAAIPFGSAASEAVSATVKTNAAGTPPGYAYTSTLSGEVDHAYLESVLSAWRSKSQTFRRADAFRYGTPAQALRTETPAGQHAAVSGFFLWTAEDMSWAGEVFYNEGWHAWAGSYQLEVVSQVRGNAPRVVDNSSESGTVTGTKLGAAIYNAELTTVELLEEITEKRWRDGNGIFDTGTAGTFDGVAWVPSAGWQLGDLMLTRSATEGSEGIGQLVSADGVTSYRATLQSGYWDSEWVTDTTRVVTVAPGSAEAGRSFQFPMPDSDAAQRPTAVRMLSLEKLTSSGWETLPDTDFYPAIQPNPLAEGALLVLLLKIRIGNRWGHVAFDNTEYADGPQAQRFKTKRLNRQMEVQSL